MSIAVVLDTFDKKSFTEARLTQCILPGTEINTRVIKSQQPPQSSSPHEVTAGRSDSPTLVTAGGGGDSENTPVWSSFMEGHPVTGQTMAT